MSSDADPCVFIYGPETAVVNTIIHGLTGCSSAASVSDLVISYPWHIDNKYYTASVQLCHVQRKGLPDKALADRCEAVVIWFNSDQVNGLDEVDSILAFTKEFEPDVCILVCETCHENTSVSRLRAQEWCVGHGFELVELSPAEEVDPDDDFPETVGVPRISQALHAHTWSNLELKDHQPGLSNKLLHEMSGELSGAGQDSGGQTRQAGQADSRPSASAARAGQQTETTADNRDVDAADTAVDSLVSEMAALIGQDSSSAGGGEADFDLLFSRLAELRAAASRVPESQRHDYAEKVALAFLRSMGGDEEQPPGEDTD